ncbi:MAG: hypothetical protein QGH39_05600, partial [Candidatus Thermoplasmatota archaeon]|nr:hypothetical protein [Candidatus Thermoplasmatota archaeon]
MTNNKKTRPGLSGKCDVFQTEETNDILRSQLRTLMMLGMVPPASKKKGRKKGDKKKGKESPRKKAGAKKGDKKGKKGDKKGKKPG